ncbi:hypothetical protein [Citromicrobium bathyomarinum]|uniref:hypothetical protein n=1 Tax=Citromicrobium bathyomarinum TaxID=72174 RepID=UPI00315A55E2
MLYRCGERRALGSEPTLAVEALETLRLRKFVPDPLAFAAEAHFAMLSSIY